MRSTNRLGYVVAPLTEDNTWCVMWDDGLEGEIVHFAPTEEEAKRVRSTLTSAFPHGPVWAARAPSDPQPDPIVVSKPRS